MLEINQTTPNIAYDAITNDAFKYSISKFLDDFVNFSPSVKGMDLQTIIGDSLQTVTYFSWLRNPRFKALEVSTLRRFGGSHWLLSSQLSQLPDNLKPSWVSDLESGIV